MFLDLIGLRLANLYRFEAAFIYKVDVENN